MSTVLLASFNTAVERLMVARRYVIGGVNRLDEDHLLAGGKGVNSARVLAQLSKLGSDVSTTSGLLCGLLGGTTGDFVETALAIEGLSGVWHRTASPTRVSDVLVDPDDSARATVFNGRGHPISAADVEAATALFEEQIGSAAGVVCSGSVPPGTPSSAYRRWIEIAGSHRRWSLLDAHGPVFAEAVQAGPTIVKINRDELAELSAEPRSAIQEWRSRGTRAVIITDGSRQFHAITPDGVAEVTPPTVVTRSGVGSGDAFTAGLVAALERGDWRDWETALRLAAACGAANATGLRAGLPDELTGARLRALMDGVRLIWQAGPGSRPTD